MNLSEETWFKVRKIKNYVMIALCFLALIIGLIPLISILAEVIINGISQLNIGFLTQEIAPLSQPGGGIAPAIEGTFVAILFACLIGIPIGIFSGIFLAEYPGSKLAFTAGFLSDVLSNMPSIVIGIFTWILIVTITGWSILAGGFALGIMMIPLITRATEESIKLVPSTVKEAALALGIPQWKTTLTVTVPTAKKGIVTGILLAIARVAGETAPLLLTILGSRFFLASLFEPAAALPLTIFNSSQSPFISIDWPKAWGASIVLIFLVLFLNIIVRILTREKY
ncbi:MAG: phosphate ABC transporter permease PstA [Promethearchaeota archaeon]